MMACKNRTNDGNCKKYNAIDILKLMLAVLVMVIHSEVDKTVISPLLRTAVPLFFIVSSYFFFKKSYMLSSEKEKKAALRKMVKRNLLLYLFWSVVQFPLWFFVRGYHQEGLLGGTLNALKGILLGGGFTGAWYIVALVTGMVIAFFASKIIPSIWLPLLTLPFFVFSCLLTNYYNIFDTNFFVMEVGDGYYALTGMHFYTSFPVALFWISIGRFLAENELAIRTSILWIAGTFFAGLLTLERYYIVKGGFALTDDCYFMLVLICPIVFLLVNKSKFTIKTRFPIREMSVLLYVSHGCCGRVAGYLLKEFPVSDLIQTITKMLLSMIVSYVLFCVIRWLKDEKKIKIFKFAY